MTLSEKYRPADLSEIIGHGKVKSVLERLELGGRALYLCGKSGVGKTTFCRIMATEIADPLYITEIVGRQLTVVGLREMVAGWCYYPLSVKPGYALIVNESHGLSRPVIEVLLDVIENLPSNVTIFFTTTRAGDDLFEDHIDAGPFRSRCLCLKLAERGLSEPMAVRLREIADLEGLNGRPLKAYIELVNQNRQNMRECLSQIECGAMLDS